MSSSAFQNVQVISVRHWNDKLFSFQVDRDPTFRFRNGEFVMLGLEVNGKPLMRAYSIASPNYEENLEFLSIKVEDGALTSRLQHIQPGDSLLISKKPTGTLVIDDLSPAENLYLIATGTGVAPFRSILLDIEVWQRFKRVVLFQGVRRVSDLAYYSLFHQAINDHPYIGEYAREQFYYCPSVTREAFGVRKRITHLVESGQMFNDLDIAPWQPGKDVVMLCGNQAMLDQMQQLLISQGFTGSPKMGVCGDYVIERAFVDR